MEMSTADRGTTSKRTDTPAQSSANPRKKRKTRAKKLCCCSWGPECKQIRGAVMKLPEGSPYDLWKAENTNFSPSSSAQSQKFEEVIRRHLGVVGRPGFESDDGKGLNLLEQLKSLNNMSDDSVEEDDDSNAQKVNQWRFRSVKGVTHNGEYFFNNGSLSGDALFEQFMHVVSCYEAIHCKIVGFECDAGGQNARLLAYLRGCRELGIGAWLDDNLVLVRNPSDPSRFIACWFCATHQLKNMRNALLNSRQGGTRNFVKDKLPMSWLVIEETFCKDNMA
jgi:hypothetical protein